MAFAANGAAIIGGVVVPATEVKVLQALVQIGRPATVPEMAKVLENTVSDASLYSLLNRLNEQRRLVAREAVELDVFGTKVRRVMWSARQAATSFFYPGPSRDESREERAQEPAGAAG